MCAEERCNRMWLLAHHIHGDGSSCWCSLCNNKAAILPAPNKPSKPQGSQPNGPLKGSLALRTLEARTPRGPDQLWLDPQRVPALDTWWASRVPQGALNGFAILLPQQVCFPLLRPKRKRNRELDG